MNRYNYDYTHVFTQEGLMIMPDKPRKVTRADVAKHAGVSETIVSYVVNNNRYVDSNKRERVEAAIRELNYRPNMVARMMKGKQSRHLAFIADNIANEHFNLLVAEMEKAAYDKGYMISLCKNRNTGEFVAEIISRQYDGIIINSLSFPEEYIEKFIDMNIPVILFHNRDFSPSLSRAAQIDTGLYQGARDCVSLLAAGGRKHILYLDRFSMNHHYSTMQDLRFRGFMEQMEECGLKVDSRSILSGCRNEEEVSDQLRKMLEAHPEIDAVMGRNDQLACIAIHVLHEMERKIPGDVAVIGFDNSNLSKYMMPTLTTVEIDRKVIGHAVVETLSQMIEGRPAPGIQVFPAKLVVRQSS